VNPVSPDAESWSFENIGLFIFQGMQVWKQQVNQSCGGWQWETSRSLHPTDFRVIGKGGWLLQVFAKSGSIQNILHYQTTWCVWSGGNKNV